MSQKEEILMRVAEEKTLEYQEENQLPESDDIEMLVKENTKRERADTLSVLEPQGKKVKT